MIAIYLQSNCFIIIYEDNLKKIIKHIDFIKNDFASDYSSIFQLEPFLYKPLLCEFLNGDDACLILGDNLFYGDFKFFRECIKNFL